MIDSHCHLADAKFRQDLPEVLRRAEEAGVHHYVCIADSLDEAEECRKLAENYDQIFYTVGVHPHHASAWEISNLKFQILNFAHHPKCVALGEIGLDYHYMNSPKEDQIRALRDQIALAKELNLPIVVHNRESIADLQDVLSDLQPPKMVLHCCTERWEDVASLVDRGYLLGFTGIATYPKSEVIRETIAHCPLSQLMIETDAPYLAPEGFRGKRCEPMYVADVAKLIAKIKGISPEEVDRITTENTIEFYSLPL